MQENTIRHNVYCQFEAGILPVVTRGEVEDAIGPLLALLGEEMGSGENYEGIADLWFDGDTVVACVKAYVGPDFPDALDAARTALGSLASRPSYATLANKDGNGPGPALLERRYRPPSAPPSP